MRTCLTPMATADFILCGGLPNGDATSWKIKTSFLRSPSGVNGDAVWWGLLRKLAVHHTESPLDGEIFVFCLESNQGDSEKLSRLFLENLKSHSENRSFVLISKQVNCLSSSNYSPQIKNYRKNGCFML